VEETLRVIQESIRVLITGTTPVECENFKSTILLCAQFQTVAIAVSKKQILEILCQTDISVGLINADLEDGLLAGLHLLPELTARYPETPFILLLDSSKDDVMEQAFRAGAKEVLVRSEEFIDAVWKSIRRVVDGQVLADGEQSQLLLSAVSSTAMPIPMASSRGTIVLAIHEREVANLVAQGFPNKTIAHRLRLTESTIGNSLFHILNKIGVSSRIELALWACEQAQFERLIECNPETRKSTTSSGGNVSDPSCIRVQGAQPMRSDALCARMIDVAKTGSLGE
jgi:DNA-binding NarL/FixJ family response regulator